MVLRRTRTTVVKDIYPYVAYMTFQNLIEGISEPEDVGRGHKVNGVFEDTDRVRI